MTFPTTGLLDNFNRSNAANLGGNWTDSIDGGTGTWTIVSNQAVSDSSNLFSSAYWNPATFGPDSEVYATRIAAIAPSERFYLYARITATGASSTAYIARWGSAGDSKSGFEKNVAGVNSTIGSDVSITFAANDVLGLEIIGTSLKMYQNGTQRNSATDSSISGAGNIGIQDSALNAAIDNFSGGTVVTGGPPVFYYPPRVVPLKLAMHYPKLFAFLPPITTAPPATQVFPQALDATINITSSIRIQVNKNLSATINITSSIQKQVNKAMSATVNITSSLVKIVQKTFSATINLTASIQALKVILKALSATINITASVQKQVNKPLSATINLTGSIQKQIAKALSATVNITASILKVINKNISSNINITATMQRQVAKVLSATVNITSDIKKQVNKALSATVNLTASVQKQVNKAFSAVINLTASITALKVILVALQAGINITATMRRNISKNLSGSITIVANITKLMPKTLSAGINLTSSMTATFKAAGAAVVKRALIIIGRF